MSDIKQEPIITMQNMRLHIQLLEAKLKTATDALQWISDHPASCWAVADFYKMREKARQALEAIGAARSENDRETGEADE